MSCRPETSRRGTTMATLTPLLKCISFQGEGESKTWSTQAEVFQNSTDGEFRIKYLKKWENYFRYCKMGRFSWSLWEKGFEWYTHQHPGHKGSHFVKLKPNSHSFLNRFTIDFDLPWHLSTCSTWPFFQFNSTAPTHCTSAPSNDVFHNVRSVASRAVLIGPLRLLIVRHIV